MLIDFLGGVHYIFVQPSSDNKHSQVLYLLKFHTFITFEKDKISMFSIKFRTEKRVSQISLLLHEIKYYMH